MFSGIPFFGPHRAGKSRQQKHRKRTGSDRRERQRKLLLEALEDRRLLAVRVWDGGGGAGSTGWSNPANWAADVAPQPDDNLVFPAGVTNVTSVNDFADGTRFRSVTISDAGYQISGNGVTLLDGFVYNATASGASFTAPITLGAAQSFYSANVGATIELGDVTLANLQLLTFDGRGNVQIEGVVSGTGGITKLGDGSLILGGENTFEGVVTLTQGVIVAAHGDALGATMAGTVAGAGTAIHLQGVEVAENIAIRDIGVGFDLATMGAIRSVGTATSKLTGVITMTNHGSFGVDEDGLLQVLGRVMVMPGVSDGGLTKFGQGTLELGGSDDNVITGTTTVLQGTLLLSKTRGLPTDPTPLPFNTGLVIGDNRNGVSNPATVRLGARDQVPELNFYKTNINAVTINSNGTLDLAGFNDQIGSLTMVVAQSDAADVTTGAGTLSLLGDITVNNFQGSSGLSPAAKIDGKLDLGSFFSGVSGGLAGRTITVNDTALFSLNPDLEISADISGPSYMVVTKAGGGTLRLTGDNTYGGPTRITAGVVDLGTDSALGDSNGLVAISGDAILRPIGGERRIYNPLSIDGNFRVFGSDKLAFYAPVTVTGADRRITIPDATQVTTFAGPVGEGLFPGAGITKWGPGELVFADTVSFTGELRVGWVSGNYEGGTVRFAGANGALLRNYSTMNVFNGTVILDNTAANNNDRLPDALAISLYGNAGVRLIGNPAGTSETIGSVTGRASWTGVLESDTTDGGTTRLNVWGLTSESSQASFRFVGGGTPLSADGANQINLLQAPTSLLLNNNVLATSVVVNPDGSVDMATLAGGPNGLAVVPLPPEAYVASFEASNPTSNVKIMSGTVTLDKSRTVNSLLLGPGVTINALDSTATLTVTNGPILFGGSGAINVPYLTLGTNAGYYLMSNGTGNTATISSKITGGSTGQWLMKGGAGTLVLSGANEFQSSLAVGQGIVNLRDSSALGTPGNETRVYLGAQLQLQGDLNILAETLSVYSIGRFGDPLTQLGGLYALSGSSRWAGPVNLNEGPWTDASSYFPNGGGTVSQSAGIGVAAGGATLNISGVLGGSAKTWYKFGSGVLELSGVQANSLAVATRVQQGTLKLNKAPGVPALGNSTIYIGDDVTGSATLELAADNQLGTGSTVWVGTNGTLDLNGNDQWLSGTLNLEVGPLGGGTVDIGSGGTLTVNNDITVFALGGGHSGGGAKIQDGTLAINIFNDSGAALQRTYRVNDAVRPTLANPDGVDLTISSAIVDGTGYRSGGIIKTGFGTTQFDGSGPTGSNTYTGTTTVNEGTLLLNKTGGALAMSGALTVGNNDLTSGAAYSDVVRFLQDNQLPDYQAAVVVEGTGLLDLNGKSDAIGTADGVTALTVNAGVVDTWNDAMTVRGTLTVNGNLSLEGRRDIGGIPATERASMPAQIHGKLNIGDGYARTIDVVARDETFVEAIIAADLVGSADLIKQTAGTLVLSGDNSGLTGAVRLDGIPSYNQPSVLFGSDTALGQGVVYPADTLNVAADGRNLDGSPRTLTNRFIVQNVRLGGGNDLKLTGAVDLVADSTLIVFNPVSLEAAGGIGELTAGRSLTKQGAGFLDILQPAVFSGNLTLSISTSGAGQVRLAGAGSLPNVGTATVNVGGTLVIDNLDAANSDRFRNAGAITLAGGGLEFVGNAGASVSEIVGNVQTNSNFTSSVTSISQGRPTKLYANQLTRQTNSAIAFQGLGADLGSANNQLFFYTPITTLLAHGILPFATLAKQGDLDFVTYDLVQGVMAAPALNALSGAAGSGSAPSSASAMPPTVRPAPRAAATGCRSTTAR